MPEMGGQDGDVDLLRTCQANPSFISTFYLFNIPTFFVFFNILPLFLFPVFPPSSHLDRIILFFYSSSSPSSSSPSGSAFSLLCTDIQTKTQAAATA